MGLDCNGVQCIMHAKRRGVDFSRTATIGRQGLHLTRAEFQQALTRSGFAAAAETIDRIFTADAGFAGELLRSLGAADVHAFDNSAYEGATELHDMNLPLPDRSKPQYSAVVDSGSLEHVFNFPTALANCMQMVRA